MAEEKPTRTPWNKGIPMNQSTKARISASKKGTPAWNKGKSWSPEVIKKISNSKKGKKAWNRGKSWPEIVKQKISKSKKGKSSWNKGKKWDQKTIEKITESKKGTPAWNKGKKWSQNIKEKIRRSKLALTIDIKPFYERNMTSKRLRHEVLVRDGSKCQICGKSALDIVLEIDHILPVSKGGKTVLGNLQTLCIDCNRGKGDKYE